MRDCEIGYKLQLLAAYNKSTLNRLILKEWERYTTLTLIKTEVTILITDQVGFKQRILPRTKTVIS